jgi:hypothetical protein
LPLLSVSYYEANKLTGNLFEAEIQSSFMVSFLYQLKQLCSNLKESLSVASQIPIRLMGVRNYQVQTNFQDS